MADIRQVVNGWEHDLRTKRGPQLIDPGDVLDGQVGAAVLYTSTNGSRAWQRLIQTTPGDDYRTIMVWTPEYLDAEAPTPHVAYFHGATANEQQLLIPGNKLLGPWLDLGWSVSSWRLGTTGVVSPTVDNNDGKWGNAGIRNAAPDLFDWIDAHLTLPAQGALFFGTSAGGTNAFSTAVAARTAGWPVAAICVVDGAFNLAWCYDKNYEQPIPHVQAGASANIRSQIIAAFNLPGPVRPYSGTPPEPGWVDNVDAGGYDFGRVANLGAVLPMCPISMSASTRDTLIRKAPNTDLIASKLAAVPWTEEVELIVTGNSHASSNHFVPTAINAFFQRALA